MQKILVLTFLIVCCSIFQDAASLARDWKSDVKINHMQQINTIVNNALARIRSNVNAHGNTPAANNCYEQARLSLRDATQSGYSRVSSCVYSSSTAGIANVCCQQVDSDVFNQSLEVSRQADACLKNA